MTAAAIKDQKITYAPDEVMKAGETYKGGNGATVTIKEFWEDYDGGLKVSYSAMHPDLTAGKWAAGDMTPNGMYHWIFPNGKFA